MCWEAGVNNIVYYCETKNCTSWIKQLLFNFFIGSDSPIGNSTSIEEPTQSQIATQPIFLSEQFNDLTQKISNLANKQQTLQNSVQSMSSKHAESVTNMETDVPSIPTSNSALDIVDEMKDRECRKLNLVGYNFSEGSNPKADIKAFQTLSDAVFKPNVSISKAVHLGQKITNKHRPLFLTVEDIDDKNYLISHSHFLQRHEQYNKSFIAPDRTKLERIKHKKAVDELRQRCAVKLLYYY